MKRLLMVGLDYFLMSAAAAQVSTPARLYPDLFKEVQMNQVFGDSKTFADAIPLQNAEHINKSYKAAKDDPEFSLTTFVHSHFRAPAENEITYTTDISRGLRHHIDTLWTVLLRKADTSRNSSLLPLPHPYIVPGGRFREVYYWDSYFTMLGLQQAKKYTEIRSMIDNFAYLLDQYGLIPNGNRSYYLSRSQPPFFSMMVQLLAEEEGESALIRYLPQLLKEHAFWMQGAEKTTPGTANRHVVMLPDSTIMNRYWDAKEEPREESYREDVLAAHSAAQSPESFYRDVRSAAESGWDFSSRWFADGKSMGTIQTTKLVAVDLNCLLYHLEQTIAEAYGAKGDKQEETNYMQKALRRKRAILHYCWDEAHGFFTDYNWTTHRLSEQVTIAMAYPLFCKVALPVQAQQVARQIEKKFLMPGGVATTLKLTGEQWDHPNGWAPLQYITITGLNNYGQDSLAKTIALRWISHNIAAYKETGKLLEKYNIELKGAAAKAGGGEYPLQDGFGWTNGVLLTLMNKYGVN